MLIELRSGTDVLNDPQQLEILQIALSYLLCLGVTREVLEVELSGLGRVFGGQGEMRIEHGRVDFVPKLDTSQRDSGSVELGEQRLEVLAELIRIGG